MAKTKLVPALREEETVTGANLQTYDGYSKEIAEHDFNSNAYVFNKFTDVGNPLLLNSANLFKQVLTLQNSYDIGSISVVRKQFIENINKFTNTSVKDGIEKSDVMLSRYILCTFFDEIISSTFWGKDNNWANNSLLSHFYNETYGGEKFFQLCEKLLGSTKKYIDILELIYICLSLGYEGKYRVKQRGKDELTVIKSEIFKQIKLIKGSSSIKFYEEPTASKTNNKIIYKDSFFAIFFVVLFTLGVIYSVLTYTVNTKENEIYQNIQQTYDKYTKNEI